METSMCRTCFHPRMYFYVVLCWVCAGRLTAMAQDVKPISANDSTLTDSVHELQQQVQELRKNMESMQVETEKYRAETVELRHELDSARAQSSTMQASGTNGDDGVGAHLVATSAGGQDAADDRDTRLDEEFQLLSGKIDEQYQTKVESWSKYRIRFSGIVLFNLFSNTGTVDNIDIPSLAPPTAAGSSGGSFGGTLRQSQLGFNVTGPTFAGARTSADIRLDFGGGFSNVANGVNYGLAWLRTGTARLDWTNTSVVVGQDALFFAPNSPTSFASQSIPALAYAGNLWSWTPQVRVEHRFALPNDSAVITQIGVLDNLDGAPPANLTYRAPQAGELSRQPAYATRVAWTRTVFGQPLTIGGAGYFGRQNYSFNRNVDGWAGMTDFNFPLQRMFALSGKFYRGKAVGGIGGALGGSVVTSGDLSEPTTLVHAINSTGGWVQLKFQPRSTLEFNAAFGEDNPFAADLNYFSNGGLYESYLSRNQGSIANVIYRPRSDLLFSAEYHYLKTFSLYPTNWTASQINLIMGVLF